MKIFVWIVATVSLTILAAPMETPRSRKVAAVPNFDDNRDATLGSRVAKKRRVALSTSVTPQHDSFRKDLAAVKIDATMPDTTVIKIMVKLLEKYPSSNSWFTIQVHQYLVDHEIHESVYRSIKRERALISRSEERDNLMTLLDEKGLPRSNKGKKELSRIQREEFIQFLSEKGFHFTLTPEQFEKHYLNTDISPYSPASFSKRLRELLKDQKISSDWQKQYHKLHQKGSSLGIKRYAKKPTTNRSYWRRIKRQDFGYYLKDHGFSFTMSPVKFYQHLLITDVRPYSSSHFGKLLWSHMKEVNVRRDWQDEFRRISRGAKIKKDESRGDSERGRGKTAAVRYYSTQKQNKDRKMKMVMIPQQLASNGSAEKLPPRHHLSLRSDEIGHLTSIPSSSAVIPYRFSILRDWPDDAEQQQTLLHTSD